jgi:hypothetical protein
MTMFHQNKFPHRLASDAVPRDARFGSIQKSLLLAAGLVAICVAPLGRWVHHAGREFQAAAQIQRLGGEVFLAWRLDQAIQGRAPSDLDAIKWPDRLDHHVSGVNLGNSIATIHDDDLLLFRSLLHLHWLDLGNRPITNAGLEHLACLHDLAWLDLHNTQVADVGLGSLAGLQRLEWLDLGETQITDASLSLLIGFQQLRWLNLANTRMTCEGLKQLRLALPRAKIVCTLQPEVGNGK